MSLLRGQVYPGETLSFEGLGCLVSGWTGVFLQHDCLGLRRLDTVVARVIVSHD